ncbi:hypothetical protein FRC11_008058, partial [Ceratobasidium sp. 423]
MRKYHRSPRKSRSSAQKAQVLGLTSIRMQRRADGLSGITSDDYVPANDCTDGNPEPHTGPSASMRAAQLQEELDQTKRKLKNSLHTALSEAHNKAAKCEHIIKTSAEQLENQAADTDMELKGLHAAGRHQAWAVHQLQHRLVEEKRAWEEIQAQLQATQDKNAIAQLSILDATTHLDSSQRKLEHLQAQNVELEKNRKILKKQLTRAQVKLEHVNPNSESEPKASSQSHHLNLKDPSGTIRPEVRNLLRQLVGDGVATGKIMDVIYHVVKTFNLTLTDSISARSVSRAVLEGLIQSQIQIAVEIDGAE